MNATLPCPCDFPDLTLIAQSDHFETERLLVRRTVEGDRDSLAPTLGSPGLMHGLRRDERPDPQAFVSEAVSNWEFQWRFTATFTFTLVDKVNQQVVGYAAMHVLPNGDGSLRVEPDIVIAPDFYRKGYAYEAMCGLISWVFADIRYPNDVVVDEVKALCRLCNSASIGLLKKLAVIGMEDLGLQQAFLRNPGPDEEPTITARFFRVMRGNLRP